MSKRTAAVPEKDFQTVANEYAKHSIERMREELDSEEERERISSEGALEVTVRTDWYTPGFDGANKPTEYCILLGTGGPAARIRGELNQYCEPTTAVYEYQDWFKPWTAAKTETVEDDQTLLEYAQQFWFGE
jgi:hypothetical protein